jgi:hypothetical protein
VCRPSIIGSRRHNDWLEKIDQNHRKKKKKNEKDAQKKECGKEKIFGKKK